ncbi:MAG: EVE domain-containing protein [Thaumarchaeota archaeon]|nr:EVE domain-containing protein [Nitrososphaerota archaeon]
MGTPKKRWLFKEEPSHYSFDRLQEEGRTVWTGIKNNLALKYLRTVEKGDLVMFYHTGEEKRIVGIMRATSGAYQDPGEEDERFAVVDLEPVKKLRRPVTLAEMRADQRFRGFDLLRMSRLSVMPVPELIWNEILKLGS